MYKKAGPLAQFIDLRLFTHKRPEEIQEVRKVYVCEARKFPAHLLSVMAPSSTPGKGNSKIWVYIGMITSFDLFHWTTLGMKVGSCFIGC